MSDEDKPQASNSAIVHLNDILCPVKRREMLEQWRDQRRQALAQRLQKSSNDKENSSPTKQLPPVKKPSSHTTNDKLATEKDEFINPSTENAFPHVISRSDMLELCRQARTDKLALRFLGRLKEYNTDRRKTIEGMIARKSSVGINLAKPNLPIPRPTANKVTASVNVATREKMFKRPETIAAPKQPQKTFPKIVSVQAPKNSTAQSADNAKMIQQNVAKITPRIGSVKVLPPMSRHPTIPVKQNKNSQLRTAKINRNAAKNTLEPRNPRVGIQNKIQRPENMAAKITEGSHSLKTILKPTTTVVPAASEPKKNHVKENVKNVKANTRVSISTLYRMKKPVVQIAKTNAAKERMTNLKMGNIPATPTQTKPSCTSRSNTPYPRKSVAFNVVGPPKAEHDALKKRMSDWMKKRGLEPNRFSHLGCFGLHASEMKETPNISMASVNDSTRTIEDEEENEESAHTSANIDQPPEKEIVDELDPLDGEFTTLLGEVIGAIDDGFIPASEISAWLDKTVVHYKENIEKHADYWICRAKIARKLGDGPAAIEFISSALAASAEPMDNLVKYKESCSKKKVKIPRTPREKSSDNSICDSTVYKYALADKSHIYRSCQHSDKKAKDKQELLLATATPVRRSGRLSRNPEKLSWTPHLPRCVEKLQDIPQEIRPKVLLVKNPYFGSPQQS